MSLVLSGCSAVLYETLDDSPDDMYLDWFQGRLRLTEGAGLVGPVCVVIIDMFPPLTRGPPLWSLSLCLQLFHLYFKCLNSKGGPCVLNTPMGKPGGGVKSWIGSHACWCSPWKLQ